MNPNNGTGMQGGPVDNAGTNINVIESIVESFNYTVDD